MVAFSPAYLNSLKESELNLTLPDRRDELLRDVTDMPDGEKAQLVRALRALAEEQLCNGRASLDKRYSFIDSNTPAEVVAENYQTALTTLGDKYYNTIQKEAAAARQSRITSSNKSGYGSDRRAELDNVVMQQNLQHRDASRT